MRQHNFEVNNQQHDGSAFFVVYHGLSMNPTLREPTIMEIVPYDNRPVRVGDVVYFLHTGADEAVVHRVVWMTPAGMATRGDNNSHDDTLLLQFHDIAGRVVAAWCGRKRRSIVGGQMGWVISRWLRWRRVLNRGVSRLLHPLYGFLACWGGISRWLPVSCRPRVVVFQVQERAQYWLLLGRQVIGRYDEREQHWQIQRPFRLLVDERMLPRQQEMEQNNSCQ